MIKNFKQFNEGINHLLVGPTEKEIWKSFDGLTPWQIFYKSCEIGFLQGVKYAFDNDKDNDCNNFKGDGALEAVAENNIDIVKYLIEERKLHVGIMGDSLIQASSSNGHYEMTKYLLEKGADVHANKDFPLYVSIRYNNYDIVKILLEYGATFEKYMITEKTTSEIKELIKSHKKED